MTSDQQKDQLETTEIRQERLTLAAAEALESFKDFEQLTKAVQAWLIRKFPPETSVLDPMITIERHRIQLVEQTCSITTAPRTKE